MTWKKHFKPVNNSVLPVRDGGMKGQMSSNKFNSWLPEVYQGPPNRLMRYVQYEMMDIDHEVAAALDTIAEFSTQLNEETGVPFEFRVKEQLSHTEHQILKKSLTQWCAINEFQKRVFKLFRSTLMYGDQFLIRDPQTYKLYWINPSTVEKVIVNESAGKEIEAYFIRDLDLNMQTLVATNNLGSSELGYNNSNLHPLGPLSGQSSYINTQHSPNFFAGGSGAYTQSPVSVPVDAKHIVHISLTEGMDQNWPFGVSVLEAIFKVYKQKELLEDAILIYRVHRAPERRIFFIDVGSMPPNKAEAYLQKVKLEVQQKRIPSKSGGGQNVIDASYNPMSMLEDYFFAVGQDGRSSKVETMPGGENLGQIDDLRYFNNKLMRALAVPSAYLPTGPEDGTNTVNDGRVGTAFIQEFRFHKRCKRLQNQIVEQLDREFKLFLKFRGVEIDSGTFELCFTEPKNFSDYRQIALDEQRVNLFNQVKDITTISNRYKMKRYLGLSDAEMAENERLWKEENQEIDAPGDVSMRQAGISTAGFSGFDSGMPGGDLGTEEGAPEEGTDTEIGGVDVSNVTPGEVDDFLGGT